MAGKTTLNSELENYYNKVISNKIKNEEGIFEEATRDSIFSEFFLNKSIIPNLKAIDLGYGYGNYSIFLAQKGYLVTAVDIVNSLYFENRLVEMDLKEKVQVIKEDLRLYSINENYDFFISKNVLHYLNKQDVFKLIDNMISKTNKGGVHFLVVFTNITRINHKGELITITGEADLGSDEYISYIETKYKKWNYRLTMEEYKERDSQNRNLFYFNAQKIILIAENNENNENNEGNEENK